MYFIPQKKRWFNFFAHISPVYRYTGLILLIAVVLVGWRYGLYAWLDGAISYEQTELSRLQSQLVAQAQAEHEHANFVSQLPVLKNSCSIKGRDCVGPSCYDHCSYLFEQARTIGLKVTHYHNEKEKKNAFKLSQHVSIGFLGTLAQLQQFLQALKQSCRLVQCNALSVERTESGLYSISCAIQFISPIS